MGQIIIIGGGIIGLCTAESLRRRGAEVTILDAGEPGGAASKGNAGWIVPAFSGPVPAPGLIRTSLRWMLRGDSPLYIRPRADVAFARWVLAFWRHCNARDYQAGLEATMELNQRTMALFDGLHARGVCFQMQADGVLSVYRSEAELEHDQAGLALLRPYGYEPTRLTPSELRELEPALTDAVAGGYWFPNERHVRPDDLTAGLVAHLRSNGVNVRAAAPVIGLERIGVRVTAVRTARETLQADTVVVSAGAWTPAVMRLAGVRLLIEAGKGYSLDYAPSPRPIRRPLYLHEARVAVTPLPGLVRLAGTMEFSGINDSLPPSRVRSLARAGGDYLRDWPHDCQPARAWTGLRPLTPDGLPVIGVAPGFDNLVVASGHATLGVTLGPATGEALADLVTTGQTPEVLRPFDPGRF